MMPEFLVTTAITAYERYTVQAQSEDEARALVKDEATRANLPSGEFGYGDDEEIIAVAEAQHITTGGHGDA